MDRPIVLIQNIWFILMNVLFLDSFNILVRVVEDLFSFSNSVGWFWSLSFYYSQVGSFTELNHSLFGFNKILIVWLHQNHNLLIKLLLKVKFERYLKTSKSKKYLWTAKKRIPMKTNMLIIMAQKIKKTKISNVLIINIRINNESKVMIKNGLSNRWI